MCEFTLANVELSTVGAGGHGVALTQAATAQGWVGWKRKSPQGIAIASDGTLGAGHDNFGMNGSGTVVDTLSGEGVGPWDHHHH